MTDEVLDPCSLAAAARLQQPDVGPGSRVALVAEPSPEWSLAFFAIVRAGAIVVPVETKLTGPEMSDIPSRARPVLVLCSEAVLSAGHLQTAQPAGIEHLMLLGDLIALDASPPEGFTPVDRHMHEPTVIVYTSGTTGRSRGVVLSFANLPTRPGRRPSCASAATRSSSRSCRLATPSS